MHAPLNKPFCHRPSESSGDSLGNIDGTASRYRTSPFDLYPPLLEEPWLAYGL